MSSAATAKNLRVFEPADRGELGHQPDQVRGVHHQVAVLAHVARRGRELHLHRERALRGHEVAQPPQLRCVELVDGRVDRHRQAAGHAGVDGGDHAVERARLAELVVLAPRSRRG